GNRRPGRCRARIGDPRFGGARYRHQANRAGRPRRRTVRAARRQARPESGRLCRRARRGGGGRQGRRRGQFPYLRRKQSARRVAELCRAAGPGKEAVIGHIIRWSTRNTFLVLLATAFITFAGIYAVWHTALDAIPDLSDTQVIVYTEYPGQAPQVI